MAIAVAEPLLEIRLAYLQKAARDRAKLEEVAKLEEGRNSPSPPPATAVKPPSAAEKLATLERYAQEGIKTTLKEAVTRHNATVIDADQVKGFESICQESKSQEVQATNAAKRSPQEILQQAVRRHNEELERRGKLGPKSKP